jgi:hypothetical protein
VLPPWYLRKAVLLLKAGGVPSTAVAVRIADSTHTDSVARTSEVLGALADGICRGGDERNQFNGSARSNEGWAQMYFPYGQVPPRVDSVINAHGRNLRLAWFPGQTEAEMFHAEASEDRGRRG